MVTVISVFTSPHLSCCCIQVCLVFHFQFNTTFRNYFVTSLVCRSLFSVWHHFLKVLGYKFSCYSPSPLSCSFFLWNFGNAVQSRYRCLSQLTWTCLDFPSSSFFVLFCACVCVCVCARIHAYFYSRPDSCWHSLVMFCFYLN